MTMGFDADSTGLTRKEFLKRAGLLCGLVAAPLALMLRDGSDAAAVPGGFFRIAGLPHLKYSAGFAKLCRYGRFASAQEAIRSVRDPKIEFLVYREHGFG